jgi:hypothetical protein
MMTKEHIRQRSKIEESKEASCFYCFAHYDADSIETLEWTDEEQTAICAHCSVDAIIARRLTQDEMDALHAAHFKR